MNNTSFGFERIPLNRYVLFYGDIEMGHSNHKLSIMSTHAGQWSGRFIKSTNANYNGVRLASKTTQLEDFYSAT